MSITSIQVPLHPRPAALPLPCQVPAAGRLQAHGSAPAGCVRLPGAVSPPGCLDAGGCGVPAPGVLPPAALHQMGCKLHLQEPPPLHKASPVGLQDDGSFAENQRVWGRFAFFSPLVATPKSLQTQQGIPCNGCCVKMARHLPSCNHSQCALESSSSTHLYADGRVPQAQELSPAEQAAEPVLQHRDPPQHLLVQQVLQKLPLLFLHENLAKTTQKALAWKASHTTSQMILILLVSVSWMLPGKLRS